MDRDWMWLPNRFGFSRSYQKWIFHGEEHESQPNEQNDIGVDTEIVDATDADILNEVVDALNDACGHIDNDINLEESTTHGKFDYLLGEANKELYPGCKKFSALTFLVKLMHIKVLNRWSDKSFDMLLQVLVDAFPERSNIPKTYYDAKKMLRDLGLGYDSIHACKYDCALFWKENETLDKCPVCDEPRYKFCNGKGKKIPQKVLRHFPLKSRLQRLFMSRHTTSDMRWHKEKRISEEGVLRHPADSEAWKDMDTQFPWFSQEPRNVRLGLATDGFNPFGSMSNSYSMWPIVLVPYNMAPWRSGSTIRQSTTSPISKEEFTKAHWYIMNNCPELRPYLDEHTKELERTSSHNLEKQQEQEFHKWLTDRMKALRVKQSPEAIDELYSLACGPNNRVHTYMGCIVNGVRFHTKDRDDRRITQNSGICVSREHDGEEVDFYGVLSNVVVLNYVLGYKVILFKCTWFNTNQKKKRIKHDYNFTTIQVTSTWYDNDPFILTTQAQQVFYLDDYKNGHNWKVVQKVNHRHMWDVPEKDTNIEIDEEVCRGSDEEAYQDNAFHELKWFVEQDDGFEFQRSNRLNIDLEVVNDNVLILENMNDNDDNFICGDIKEEDETLDDYANENEMWLSSDSESESD
ncbi:hypothetical protein CK203_099152 [Vitis vinifera]|uniref:DUF4216 domain-containing protein n=1 Tax=Vitis vinifera TaxID=29760 RepID=A0A438CWQ7_VITVI|nr:hypothetical protein CK203_099152 [Vitis vinifera]